jgi:hypothetical protein
VPPFAAGDTLSISAANGISPIYGGDYFLQCNVHLSNPAGSNGQTVDVTTPDPGDLQLQEVPLNITPGFEGGSFMVNAAQVTAPVHTTVTASADGVSTTVPITIEPGITGVTVPATIASGQSATGTVTLAGPVDTDTTVILESTWGVLSVPAAVTVKKGHSSATFPITTVSGSSGDQVSLGTTSVNTSTTLS